MTKHKLCKVKSDVGYRCNSKSEFLPCPLSPIEKYRHVMTSLEGHDLKYAIQTTMAF